MTAPTSSKIARPLSEEDQHDQVLRALQSVVMSGLMETGINTQASCLSLCNTCRVSVPAQSLTVCPRTPPSILAMLCPRIEEAKTDDSSRVLPYRRVLKVHWMFLAHQECERMVGESGWRTEYACEERQRMSNRETCLGSSCDCNVEFTRIQWPEGSSGLEADCHVGVSSIQWPEETREIALIFFNGNTDDVTWPAGLKILWLGEPRVAHSMAYGILDIFNGCLWRLPLPSGLRELFLGDKFNCCIEYVEFPKGLERLSMPGFNQSLRNVEWPAGLKALEFVSPKQILLWTGGAMYADFVGADDFQLTFSPKRLFITSPYLPFNATGSRFNQPLGNMLPPSLETLWLSEAFDQPLDDVAWPEGLVTLGLACDIHYLDYMTSMVWPTRLHDLFLRIVCDDIWIECPRGINLHILDTRKEGKDAIFDVDRYISGQ